MTEGIQKFIVDLLENKKQSLSSTTGRIQPEQKFKAMPPAMEPSDRPLGWNTWEV